ncbi:MAG TPA: hypothetical protein VIY28_03185 [Pseudonocardiaceae bacterium]
MSVPVPRYGPFAPRPSHSPPPMNVPSSTGFMLGLLAAFVLVICASWLAGGTQQIATAPAVLAPPPPPTPAGSAVAFDSTWTFTNGNSIVAGEPTVGRSDSTFHRDAPVIRVAVTLTNVSDQEWSPVFTTYGGTRNGTPLQESGEGDWLYSTPIVPHSSVTLSRAFLGSPGQFTLTVHSPHGVATFSGQA